MMPKGTLIGARRFKFFFELYLRWDGWLGVVPLAYEGSVTGNPFDAIRTPYQQSSRQLCRVPGQLAPLWGAGRVSRHN